jgi:hypothetical protein
MRRSPQTNDSPQEWFFLLEQQKEEVVLVLQEIRTVRQIRSNDGSSSEVSIENLATPTFPYDSRTHIAVVNHYNLILSSFYSLPLTVPLSSTISTLSVAESLVSISANLNCTHLISAPLSALIHSHHRTLYTSIATDPARYLALAITLHDSSIYTESLIHIIGAWPCWPWPTRRETLPTEILDLVMRKAEGLEQMCTDAERDLLLLTIQIGNTPVEPSDHSQFDTWFVVQMFRDTLARTFHGLDCDSNRSLKRGTLYRRIRRGGTSYMPYEEMRRVIGRVMSSALECLEEDLDMLKRLASAIVREVARNELVLDVEESNVGYLTCVKIGKGNLPWLAHKES